jgi:hypothetical protein
MTLKKLFLFWLAWPVIAAPAAETLAIDWYTVDGGGGTVSSGDLTVSGTVGQPDARVRVGACCGWSLSGGFWSLYTDVWQPNGPVLCMRVTSTNTVFLSWPEMWGGYRLQTNTSLAPVTWGNLAGAQPVLVDRQNQIVLDAFYGAFWRWQYDPEFQVWDYTFFGWRTGYEFWYGTNFMPAPPNARYVFMQTNNTLYRLIKP